MKRLRAEAVINGGWEVSTPETALGFSAIGHYFGSRLQRALQIPIGIISNARGGASIESLVPAHKFDVFWDTALLVSAEPQGDEVSRTRRK